MSADPIRRRRYGRWRATPALPLLALLAATLPGCAPADAPLTPVFRLTQDLDPPLDQTPLHCDVADDFRPAVGCVPTMPLPIQGMPRPEGRVLTVPVKIWPHVKPDLVVFEPRVRGPREEWRRTPVMLMEYPPGGTVDLKVPLPEQVKGDQLEVQVLIRPVPPNRQERLTRALPIGRGAVLQVALGLDRTAGGVRGSPVRFRLIADAESGPVQLLESKLVPGEDRGWQPHEIDLGRFAGQRVRFRLESEVIGRAGATASETFGFPLWGSAQILEPRARDGRRNVILISLDTLRGDQLGGTLDGKPLMPKLAARSATGARFTDAYTTYPSTTAGHMSMLTGLYPARHGMVFATGYLDKAIPTLPEILARNGYATAAVTEDAMLTAYVGFVRGFDEYREIKGKTMWETSGEIEQTFGAGLDWVEKHRDERFFLFLHTYQVHVPYTPPPAHDVFRHWEKDGQRVPIDASTPPAVRDRHLYAGEVRYTDDVLDRLLERLDALGVLDDTIVVVTADHGDEFGEHGLIGHAKTVYDEVLHVPLIILSPHLVPAGRTIDTPVSLVDLLPTLLDLVRLPAPRELHGESLVPLLHGGRFPATRVLYAEAPKWGSGTGPRVAARVAGLKWIASGNRSHGVKHFDLTTDPGEQKPLDGPDIEAIGRVFEDAYRSVLAAAHEAPAAESKPGTAKKPEIDDATVEKLKALGYMD
ncbi:MAG: sulfatase [Deltaproteobacteria bacterium]|nr:sulfatase [Deltaproteobacteria bacterium]